MYAGKNGRASGTPFLKKRESEAKRSGAAAGTFRRWKYSAVLSFLDPHVTPRATASNMERGVGEDRTAEEPGRCQAEQDPSQAEDWAELSVAGPSGGGGGWLNCQVTHSNNT